MDQLYRSIFIGFEDSKSKQNIMKSLNVITGFVTICMSGYYPIGCISKQMPKYETNWPHGFYGDQDTAL